MARPRLVTDAAILAAARAAFLQQGWGAPTREIARAAGLSQPALLQRAGDKTALFLAALSPEPLDVPAIIGDALAPTAPGSLAVLQGIATRLLDALREVVPLLLALATGPAAEPAARDAIHQHLRGETLRAQLAVILGRWQREGVLPGHLTPDPLVDALSAGVHGILLQSRLTGRQDHAAERAAVARQVALLWGPVPA